MRFWYEGTIPGGVRPVDLFDAVAELSGEEARVAARAFGYELIAGPAEVVPPLAGRLIAIVRPQAEGRFALTAAVQASEVRACHEEMIVVRRLPAESESEPASELVSRTKPAPKVAAAEADGIDPWVPADDTPVDNIEAARDPIVPVRTPLVLRGRVGRGGTNDATEVLAVQRALIAVRRLSAPDANAERPTGTGPVPDARLTRTIEAIERLQRDVGRRVDGRIDPRGTTLRNLNSVIPTPTPAERTAMAARRAAIALTQATGATITGAVGRTSRGNAVADVRTVQRRLVEVGALDSAHGESPAAGATERVRSASLPRTIVAIRRFQREVRRWRSRRTIAGRITPRVVAPGDATLALLGRITRYTITVGSTTLSLRDYVDSRHTRDVGGVSFRGTARPSAIPVRDYLALGLTAPQAAALRWVSRHEGNFDAINTYDRARVSVGFIQFAGGRGLPPYLALLKSRHPRTFRERLGRFGIDVEFDVVGGDVNQARVVVVDPATGSVRRGSEAEAVARDDKRLTAVLILSGRDPTVQRAQIEAATRNYVLEALAKRARIGGRRVRLERLIHSERGLAMLFDRAIQEGTGRGPQRFRRVAEARAREGPPGTMPTEQAILAGVVDDLEAAAGVFTQSAAARAALATLDAEARDSDATVAGLLSLAALTDARSAVANAIQHLGNTVSLDAALLRSIRTSLTSAQSKLRFSPPPGSLATLRTEISASSSLLSHGGEPLKNAPAFKRRIDRIVGSSLRSP